MVVFYLRLKPIAFQDFGLLERSKKGKGLDPLGLHAHSIGCSGLILFFSFFLYNFYSYKTL